MRTEDFRNDRLCERGDYWLAKRPESPNFYIFWYDSRVGKVLKRTTGYKNFPDAKRVLEYVHLTNPNSLRSAEPALFSVLAYYWETHASKLGEPTSSAAALKHWLGYFDQRTAILELNPDRIKGFWDHLRGKGLWLSPFEP